MNPASTPLPTSSESAHTGRLPLEVTDICLRFFVESAKQDRPQTATKEIALLRLACKHFREVISSVLFGHVDLCLLPEQARTQVFLNIMRNRNATILQHIRHITIRFESDTRHRGPSSMVTGLVDILAKAPFTTLTISGLRAYGPWPLPPEYTALLPLRCGRNLENLVIFGETVPSFLVCGHIGSTPLKSIEILGPSYAYNEAEDGSAIEGGSTILAKKFQPLVELERLSILNPRSFPHYFPLHDFGPTHYPSNNRIPATFPSLKTLRVGNHLRLEDTPALKASDYKAVAALLSLAPQLEELFITDNFSSYNGVYDRLAPLVQQLSTTKGLKRLEFEHSELEDQDSKSALSALYNLITPLSGTKAELETLSLRLRWPSVHPDATRRELYFSNAWKEFGRVVQRASLASLHHLVLHVGIKTIRSHWEPPCPEIMGRGELKVLEEVLEQELSEVLDKTSKLRVQVNFTFDTCLEF